MTILGAIWDKWASENTIINAAKRVGISKDGLNVNDMQQDKFQQAADLIAQNQEQGSSENPGPGTPKKVCTRSSTHASLTAATPRSISKLAKGKHRYGSADYWKSMYEQSQAIIHESYEKSLKLEDIPGLLTVNRVKSKELNKNKNTRVTNVHGSMEGQDVLKLVESIENEKKEKQNHKEKKTQQKNKEKELFYRCKIKCVCNGICAAKGLKECPVCHEIKKSVCSKASCRVDGMKPMMITPATATSTRRKKNYKDESDSDESHSFEEESDNSEEEDDDAEISEENESECKVNDENGNGDASKKLLETWCCLSPPIKESEIVGKWFAGIYESGRSRRLCIGQILKRFLKDENGDVDAIEMRCLKPKVGLSTIMEDTPDHLPDIGIFKIHDVIGGPLEVLPLRGKKWDVPNYERIAALFREVSGLNREHVMVQTNTVKLTL